MSSCIREDQLWAWISSWVLSCSSVGIRHSTDCLGITCNWGIRGIGLTGQEGLGVGTAAAVDLAPWCPDNWAEFSF